MQFPNNITWLNFNCWAHNLLQDVIKFSEIQFNSIIYQYIILIVLFHQDQQHVYTRGLYYNTWFEEYHHRHCNAILHNPSWTLHFKLKAFVLLTVDWLTYYHTHGHSCTTVKWSDSDVCVWTLVIDQLGMCEQLENFWSCPFSLSSYWQLSGVAKIF